MLDQRPRAGRGWSLAGFGGLSPAAVHLLSGPLTGPVIVTLTGLCVGFGSCYTPTTGIATISASSARGVVVECVREGGRVRVHVVSGDFEPSWNVQFPRSIREVGARYVVDALHPAPSGFYRVRGDIRRLV